VLVGRKKIVGGLLLSVGCHDILFWQLSACFISSMERVTSQRKRNCNSAKIRDCTASRQVTSCYASWCYACNIVLKQQRFHNYKHHNAPPSANCKIVIICFFFLIITILFSSKKQYGMLGCCWSCFPLPHYGANGNQHSQHAIQYFHASVKGTNYVFLCCSLNYYVQFISVIIFYIYICASLCPG
jgi:hypothetical protein